MSVVNVLIANINMSGFTISFKRYLKKKVILMALTIVSICFITFYSYFQGYDLSILLNRTVINKHIELETKNYGEDLERDSIFEEYKMIRMSSLNVFFIESTCGTGPDGLRTNHVNEKVLKLNLRQVCAVESAAITNPDRSIYVLYTCPLSDDFIYHSPNFVKVLFHHKNIQIVRLDMETFYEYTPLLQLYQSKRVEQSNYRIEIASDLMRIVVLCRFGGTYLDLDTITIKSLKHLSSNYIGLESSTSVGGGVINVEPFGSGQNLMNSVLQYIRSNFDPNVWGANCPDALSSVILRQCHMKAIDETIYKCKVINVLPPHKFYPVHFRLKDILFERGVGVEN